MKHNVYNMNTHRCNEFHKTGRVDAYFAWSVIIQIRDIAIANPQVQYRIEFAAVAESIER